MLIKGLLSIILVFLLVSFFIGHAAKKHGKNPWLLGGASFLLITALSWKQMPSWAAYIYYKGMVAMQSMKPKEPITTLAEAKKINIHSSVDGVHFDVPLTYHFRGYDQKNHGWPSVSEGQIAGTERPAVDFIHIYALLPDIASMSEENLAEFEVLGYGKKVMASLTHYRPWDYYFNNTFARVEQRSESPEVKGMLHYYDPHAKHDLYLSHDHATPDLTEIICNDEKFFHSISPSCGIKTSYRPPSDLVKSKHIEGVIFQLEYHFSSQYLEHWREIDQKLKSLFERFIRSAHNKQEYRTLSPIIHF